MDPKQSKTLDSDIVFDRESNGKQANASQEYQLAKAREPNMIQITSKETGAIHMMKNIKHNNQFSDMIATEHVTRE